MEKNTREKLQISFTILKSIYNISCVCLTVKEKFLLFFFTLTYTLLMSHEGNNILLSPPWLSSQRRQPFALSSLAISSKVASRKPFFLSRFHSLFSLSP